MLIFQKNVDVRGEEALKIRTHVDKDVVKMGKNLRTFFVILSLEFLKILVLCQKNSKMHSNGNISNHVFFLKMLHFFEMILLRLLQL